MEPNLGLVPTIPRQTPLIQYTRTIERVCLRPRLAERAEGWKAECWTHSQPRIRGMQTLPRLPVHTGLAQMSWRVTKMMKLPVQELIGTQIWAASGKLIDLRDCNSLGQLSTALPTIKAIAKWALNISGQDTMTNKTLTNLVLNKWAASLKSPRK